MLKKKYHNSIASTYKDVIIVYDRDQLLQSYPTLQEHFQNEGYNLHFCSSLLELRVTYELNVRHTNEKHLLALAKPTLPLPDILKESYYTEVGLRDLFPKLDTEVLKGLSYRTLDNILELPNFDDKSRKKTIKFILEGIYNIDFDSLIDSNNIEPWLASLLNLYSHNATLNEAFLTFFSNAIEPIDSDVSTLIGSKADLLAFLQNEWRTHVQDDASEINFSHNLLTKELTQLFIRGELKPVEVSHAKESNFEYSIDVYVDEKASLKKSFAGLKEEIIKDLRSGLQTIDDWLNFLPSVSHLKYVAFKIDEDEYNDQVKGFEKKINKQLQKFIDNHYTSLFTLSGKRHPATVTRILDYMHGIKSAKKAVIVIDGLNLWQWELLRENLNLKQASRRVSLAWIPTITAWSRQAIFKGSKPDLTQTNRNEEKLFKQYWMNKGVQKYQIEYYKFGNDKQIVNDIDFSKKILGFVTNDIDELMHGTVMGNQQFFQNTKQWAENGLLKDLITTLK